MSVEDKRVPIEDYNTIIFSLKCNVLEDIIVAVGTLFYESDVLVPIPLITLILLC